MLSKGPLLELFVCFLKLGCTSFGGPIAHLGYFHDEFVRRRHWLSERDYTDLVALCQFLPGPASSQVGMAIGMIRGHYLGALVAWLGFTLPSAVLLIGFALSLKHWGSILPTGVIHGLKLVAVAVVVQALWSMAKTLCNSGEKIALTLISVVILVCWTSLWSQVLVMALCAFLGALLIKPGTESLVSKTLPLPLSKKAAFAWGWVFIALLFLLPALAALYPSSALSLLEAFFRAGSLVFGGGHVVLPLLHAEVVPNGWVSPDQFIAGYAAAQAVPGPLFSFAAYLGAAMQQGPTGVLGGLIALCAIFLPAFMVLAAALPFWHALRMAPMMQAVMAGVGAAVVGVVAAALYNPIGVSAISSLIDAIAVLVALLALMYWKWPPYQVVIATALLGALVF